MNALSLILMILKLFQQFKSSKDSKEFAANVRQSGRLSGAPGPVLQWLWDNREMIIEFIKALLASKKDPQVFGEDPQVREIQELANKLSGTSDLPAGLEDLPEDQANSLREDSATDSALPSGSGVPSDRARRVSRDVQDDPEVVGGTSSRTDPNKNDSSLKDRPQGPPETGLEDSEDQ